MAKKLTEMIEEGEYGGIGKFHLPNNHHAALPVPKGGSCCANCKFVSEDKKRCSNKYYIEWNGGSNMLLHPADSFCSDWWESK